MKLRCDSKHRYYLGRTRKPGFTEICTAVGIIEPNRFYTDQGREEGISLSKWLLFLCQGAVPTRPPHPAIAARVEAIKSFIRDSQFRLVGGEVPQYDPKVDACCTPDIWGFIGTNKYVIDAKRGSPLPFHAVQTAAQAMALEFAPDHRAALYLGKNGKPKLVHHEDPNDFKVWRKACADYHLKGDL